MINTYLVTLVALSLTAWVIAKLASWFTGLYVALFGTAHQQDLLASNPTMGYRLGLLATLWRRRSRIQPMELRLKAAEAQLEALKVERRILEVRREIDALKEPAPTQKSLAAAVVPVVAAAAIPATAAEPAAVKDEADLADTSGVDAADQEPPTDAVSPVIRDPMSGDLIAA